MATTSRRPGVIMRPNGKPYRPRRLVTEEIGGDDGTEGILVLGTHDQHRAQPLADEAARRAAGSRYVAAGPLPGWWRDTFDGGRRVWVTDEEHGRAGVWFRSIAESSRPPLAAAEHVAPAAKVLTVLHRPDPASVPDEDPEGNPVDGWTVCGEPMKRDDLWRPIDHRPDDKLCGLCFPKPGQPAAIDVQEVLL